MTPDQMEEADGGRPKASTRRQQIFRLCQGLGLVGGQNALIRWAATHPDVLLAPDAWVSWEPHPPGCNCTEYCLLIS